MGFDGWLEVSHMDELARRDTPVHRVDARAKALTTVFFIAVVMSFPRYELSALTPFFLYPAAFVFLGEIPPGILFRKMLAAAPFAVAVGLFNPFFDRTPVLGFGAFSVSGGWLSFASILMRFVLTAGAALALVACTGMHRLCEGLVRLGVPRLFAVQLLFLYRYLFIVADEAGRVLRGIELRAGGRRALRFRVYASLVGHLLLRAMARAERVYRAMQARGFDGRVRVSRPMPLRWRDPLFVCGWAVFFAVARTWNLAGLLGGVLTGGR
jgi:cobalt/nickel transport system permease protein